MPQMELNTKLCKSGPAHHCQSLKRWDMSSPMGKDEPEPSDFLHPLDPAGIGHRHVTHFHPRFLPPIPCSAFVTPAAFPRRSSGFGAAGSRAHSNHGDDSRARSRHGDGSRVGEVGPSWNSLQARRTTYCCTRIDTLTPALSALIQCSALPDKHLPKCIATNADGAGTQGNEE